VKKGFMEKIKKKLPTSTRLGDSSGVLPSLKFFWRNSQLGPKLSRQAQIGP
jgi:hypothetical protein